MSHDSHAEKHHPHVLPMKVYIGVWLGLLFLTVVTVAVSYVDVGPLNIVLAMLVAAIKGSLVCAYFMHLKYDDRFNTTILISAFGFLALLFVYTLADLQRRGEIDPIERGTIEVLPKSSIPSDHDGHSDETPGAAGHGEGTESGQGADTDADH